MVLDDLQDSLRMCPVNLYKSYIDTTSLSFGAKMNQTIGFAIQTNHSSLTGMHRKSVEVAHHLSQAPHDDHHDADGAGGVDGGECNNQRRPQELFGACYSRLYK